MGKRNIIFPNNARKIIFQCNCFGKTISPEKLQSLQGSSYFHVFLFEKNLLFFVLKIRYIFGGKIIILPDNARTIIFQSDFLGRSSFQNIWKKKNWFFVHYLWMKEFIEEAGFSTLILYKVEIWTIYSPW